MRLKIFLRILVFIGGLFNLQPVLSQEDGVLPTVIPPSPTAESLSNFGNIPIGYYTGTPNISVPLYKITVGDINIPITLTYNATGIRVSQDASWIGLGWSLSTGGIVSRTIRGVDDFGPYGFYSEPNLPTSNSINLLDTLQYYDSTPIPSFEMRTKRMEDGNYLYGISQGWRDGESDLFSFTCGNYSGQFVFDKLINGGKIVFKSMDTNCDVNFSNPTGTSSFIITTPDGLIYYFGTTEIIFNYSSVNDATSSSHVMSPSEINGLDGLYTAENSPRPSTWYLDSIGDPNGNTVRFHYKTNGYSLSLPSISNNQVKQMLPVLPSKDNGWSNVSGIVSRQKTQVVYLDSISFPNGFIKFNTQDRKDIEPADYSAEEPQRLSQLVVYNNNLDVIKKIDFENDHYFTSTNSSLLSYFNKRLKLNGLSINDNTNSYKFDYINEDKLPSKLSNSQDEFGFIYLTSNQPGSYYRDLDTLWVYKKNLAYVQYRIYDQLTDTIGDNSQNGLLNSITYPTKGKTVFEYEPHTFNNGHNITYHSKEVYNIYREYFEEPMEGISEWYRDTSITVFIPHTQTISFHVTTNYFNNGNNPYPDPIFARFKMLPNGGYTNIKTAGSGNKTISFELEPGYYDVYLYDDYTWSYTANGEFIYNPVDVKIDFTITQNPQIKTLDRGFGNRIKKITKLDLNGSIVGQKKFQYTKEDNQNSSGQLFTRAKNYLLRPQYYATEDTTFDESGNRYIYYANIDLFCFYLKALKRNTIPVGFSSRPNPVGYSRVIVTDQLNNGKTIYKYHNKANKEYQQNPLHGYHANMELIPQMYDPRNGKLISVEYLDSSDRLIKKSINNYICKDYEIQKGVKIYPVNPAAGESFCYYDAAFFDEISEWWVQDSTIETSYFNGEPVETVTSFQYDDLVYKQLTSKKTTQSIGAPKVESYKYPYDVSGSVYEDMVSDNILNPVIEKSVVFENTTDTLSRVKTEYDTFSGKALPEHVYVRNSETGAMEKRLTYDNYTSKGRVQGVHQENNISMAYVWGYKEQYPVLKITGLSYSYLSSNYSSIVSYFSDDTKLPVNLSFSALKTQIAELTEQLSDLYNRTDCQVELYTYDPLVGVTSQTDANGVTVYYEYDGEGRLEYLKDDDGNILKKYEYHYATVNP